MACSLSLPFLHFISKKILSKVCIRLTFHWCRFDSPSDEILRFKISPRITWLNWKKKPFQVIIKMMNFFLKSPGAELHRKLSDRAWSHAGFGVGLPAPASSASAPQQPIRHRRSSTGLGIPFRSNSWCPGKLTQDTCTLRHRADVHLAYKYYQGADYISITCKKYISSATN